LKQLNNLLSSNGPEKYQDSEFQLTISAMIPDNLNSIYLEGVDKEKLIELKGKLESITLEKIFNTRNLLLFGRDNKIPYPEDISQGIISNKYLISTIGSILATKPNILRLMFETKTFNKAGVIAIRLLLQGEPTLVMIDENFPVCIQNRKKIPAFSICKGNELWVSALEKAWTKINGKCYTMTYLGTPYEAFNSISLGPTYFYYHKKYNSRNRIDLIWNRILESKIKKYAICTSTEEINEPHEVSNHINRDNNSLIGNQSNNHSHINLNIDNSSAASSSNKLDSNLSFSVLDIIEFEEIKLLKIWCPSSKNIKWKGDYCNESENWSKELLEHIDYVNTPGVFYATFEEYLKYFSWTYICKNEDNFFYRSLKSKTYFGEKNMDRSFPSMKMDDDERKEEGRQQGTLLLLFNNFIIFNYF